MSPDSEKIARFSKSLLMQLVDIQYLQVGEGGCVCLCINSANNSGERQGQKH